MFLFPRWKSVHIRKFSLSSVKKTKYQTPIHIPKYTRINDLAKLFKTSTKKMTKELKLLKNKKHIYLKNDGIWFEFQAMSDVIIPSSMVQELSTSLNKEVIYMNDEDLLSFEDTSFTVVKSQHEQERRHQPAIPVVALLGHFNHGKTTLLDALLRNNDGTKIVDDEAHQITQVVRSRAVLLDDETDSSSNISTPSFLSNEVTIIDTPGQEIFYRMRNYGAAVADIGILVVACDDGICAQTQESIGILEQLQVPIMVALNKIDHPTVTPDRVDAITQELREYVILDDVPIIPISALLHDNIEHIKASLQRFITILNEMSATSMALVKDTDSKNKRKESEMSEYNDAIAYSYKASGTLTNQWSNQKDGQTFHVILRQGTLQPGDWFSAGGLVGTVVSILRDETIMATAVAGMGLRLRITIKYKQEPSPLGDMIYFFSTDTPARKLADFRYMENKFPTFALPHSRGEGYASRLDRQWESEFGGSRAGRESTERAVTRDGASNTHAPSDDDLEDIEGVAVIKSDTSLSMSTFNDNLEEMREHRYGQADDDDENEDEGGDVEDLPPLRRIIRNGVGDITPTDVLVAHTAKAPILAYEVGILPAAARQAENQGVKVYFFDKMEDVVSILGGASLTDYEIKKPKRRHKNSV